jgi:hypothetical protein
MLHDDNLYHKITDEHVRKIIQDRFQKMKNKKRASKHGSWNEANDEEEQVDAEQSESVAL